jgi:hypothetical protein
MVASIMARGFNGAAPRPGTVVLGTAVVAAVDQRVELGDNRRVAAELHIGVDLLDRTIATATATALGSPPTPLGVRRAIPAA